VSCAAASVEATATEAASACCVPADCATEKAWAVAAAKDSVTPWVTLWTKDWASTRLAATGFCAADAAVACTRGARRSQWRASGCVSGEAGAQWSEVGVKGR
jgi:hypothetical protein